MQDSQHIAVIGHGRSAEGKGWGSRIDACGCVIRMWDWHWQKEADYGRKYDVGFFEWHSRAYGSFRLHNVHTPKLGWIISDLRHQEVDYPIPNGAPMLALIKRGQWTYADGKLVEGDGAQGQWQLTRGTMSACWAMSQAKAGAVLVLVGFDNVRQGICLPIDEGFSKEYRESPSTFSFNGYTPGASRYGYHDFEAEGRLLAAMAKDRSVIVHYAQDHWQ